MNWNSLTNRLHRSTLLPALLSSVICWLAFPPLGWGILAWVAPVGWLLPIARKELVGWRPYRSLWLAGFAFWLLTVHWIRLPHPANYVAWVILAGYLGCYLPTFVALSRVGVHRLRLPLWIVAPVVWTGLDLVRAHLMTGFLMGSLAHTQVEYLWVIQIADLIGEYGVTFLIVLVGGCLTQCVLSNQSQPLLSYLKHLAPAALAMTPILSYGAMQSSKFNSASVAEQELRIALIQGNTRADWKQDPDRQRNIMLEYMRLSRQAVQDSKLRDGKQVDLVIWPETSFRQDYATVEEGYQPPVDRVHPSYLEAAKIDLSAFVHETNAAIFTGIDRVHVFPDETGEPDYDSYNSSVLMDKNENILGTYDKMHRVPFGEYVPFADWMPALYEFTPLTGGVRPGVEPVILQFGDFLLSPNICYESCVPHLIRQHVLHQADQVPDVLVNLTNDAWYWGSSELELHLACGIFRAVEHHIPLVVAANGGLSAHVDAFGNVLQVTPRQQTATLLVDLKKRGSEGLTFYARWGDWFAGLCVVCCVVLAVVGWRSHRQTNRSSQVNSSN